jgi:hypothetical protein
MVGTAQAPLPTLRNHGPTVDHRKLNVRAGMQSGKRCGRTGKTDPGISNFWQALLRKRGVV